LPRRFDFGSGVSVWLGPCRRPQGIGEDELFQNSTLCSGRIAQGRLAAASSRAPKLVCAFFDLLLNAHVLIHREEWRFLHCGLRSLLHFALPWPGLVRPL
jgi:hypothetical protein